MESKSVFDFFHPIYEHFTYDIQLNGSLKLWNLYKMLQLIGSLFGGIWMIVLIFVSVWVESVIGHIFFTFVMYLFAWQNGMLMIWFHVLSEMVHHMYYVLPLKSKEWDSFIFLVSSSSNIKQGESTVFPWSWIIDDRMFWPKAYITKCLFCWCSTYELIFCSTTVI